MLDDDARDLLTEFIEGGVEFLVVGAHALAAHGVFRATGDLDILVRPEPENARRAWDALHRFGAPLVAHDVTADDLATPGTVYQLGLPPRRIDVLTSITGVEFEDAWRRRVTRSAGGLELAFLSRFDLVTNKRATGRPKDLLDLELLAERPEEFAADD
jgi:hypothetical protein